MESGLFPADWGKVTIHLYIINSRKAANDLWIELLLTSCILVFVFVITAQRHQQDPNLWENWLWRQDDGVNAWLLFCLWGISSWRYPVLPSNWRKLDFLWTAKLQRTAVPPEARRIQKIHWMGSHDLKSWVFEACGGHLLSSTFSQAVNASLHWLNKCVQLGWDFERCLRSKSTRFPSMFRVPIQSPLESIEVIPFLVGYESGTNVIGSSAHLPPRRSSTEIKGCEQDCVHNSLGPSYERTRKTPLILNCWSGIWSAEWNEYKLLHDLALRKKTTYSYRKRSKHSASEFP